MKTIRIQGQVFKNTKRDNFQLLGNIKNGFGISTAKIIDTEDSNEEIKKIEIL